MPQPQTPFYQTTPISPFPKGNTQPCGSTARMIPTTGYSGARSVQTYMSTVNVIVLNGQWIHPFSDVNPRNDLSGLQPFQLFRVFTTSFSSPDGDLPYKHGDFLIPSGNLVGLVANTQHPIRGVNQVLPSYIELIVERKL